jgi:hypothetical protein
MIYEIRGQKVMIDRDLAALYGIVIFNKDLRKYKPYAFTEQGVSILKRMTSV